MRTVREAAMALLARREHSRWELARKLRARGYAMAEIDTTLEILATSGMLSNQRFAEAYIRMRIQRGYGAVRIRLELEQRGVDTELIMRSLDSYMDAFWLEQLVIVRQKRFGKILPIEQNERVKQLRFLQYRGFTMDQIYQVLK